MLAYNSLSIVPNLATVQQFLLLVQDAVPRNDVRSIFSWVVQVTLFLSWCNSTTKAHLTQAFVLKILLCRIECIKDFKACSSLSLVFHTKLLKKLNFKHRTTTKLTNWKLPHTPWCDISLYICSIYFYSNSQVNLRRSLDSALRKLFNDCRIVFKWSIDTFSMFCRKISDERNCLSVSLVHKVHERKLRWKRRWGNCC